MAKRVRPAPLPEELHKGAAVLHSGGVRGVITESYVSLDEFWLSDPASGPGEYVRDADGAAKVFKCQDLELAVAPEPSRRKPNPGAEASAAASASSGKGLAARVLLIGGEPQMLQILDHFGEPDTSEPKRPSQQVLAIPCSSCECSLRCASFDAWRRDICDGTTCPLVGVAADGVDEGVITVARRQRPDIPVKLRPFHLKQFVDSHGTELRRLEGFYCLAAVTVPFGQDDIALSDPWEARWKKQVCCQLDVGLSADGSFEVGDDSAEATARRALVESCGVRLSDGLWSEAYQLQVRHKLRADLPYVYSDGLAKVFVILLPENAAGLPEDGALRFSSPDAVAPRATAGAAAAPALGQASNWQSRSTKDWEAHQDEFKDLPKLPTDWIRIRSKKNAQIYYWNTKSNKPQFEIPLPEGWTKQFSKSTGKTYYFNAKKKTSSFDIPTE